MPELPEVETTLRSVAKAITGKKIDHIVIRQPQLRWPIPKHLAMTLAGQTLDKISRRAKYLLLSVNTDTVLIHLGMSGHLRLLPLDTPHQKHDHVDFCFADSLLRFTDPRRFGAILLTDSCPNEHPLLKNIGPEPLTQNFSGRYLYQLSRHRAVAVKNFIMNSSVVAGVGNIYAAESLFLAGIKPNKPANTISQTKYDALCQAIKEVLQAAIQQGGTTLRDFKNSDGRPGYFQVKLNVYGKAGQPCPQCDTTLTQITLGQRASVYCQQCQR